MDLIGRCFSRFIVLNLEGNNITSEGCQHLAKASWKRLTTLNLSIKWLIQLKIKSQIRVPNHLYAPSLNSSTQLHLVKALSMKITIT
jgi:hypothetical protein